MAVVAADVHTSYWKRMWRWTATGGLTLEELADIFSQKKIQTELTEGLNCYKPGKTGSFAKLQAELPDQSKLLAIVQTLQHYIDIDCHQIWSIIKHYLSDISYGTPDNALKNVAFVDTRPSFLLPNVWKFYYAERLFHMKYLQHVLENMNNEDNKYHEKFKKLITDIGLQKLKLSLIAQFKNVVALTPPMKKIQNDFSSDSVRQEWAESNLREQLVLLQCLMLVTEQQRLTYEEFLSVFSLFKKHEFGKRQVYQDLLDERHREYCTRIVHMEVAFFLCCVDKRKIDNIPAWIDSTKQPVEAELGKLQVESEHGPMLLAWMMLTLQSSQHARLFEGQYQHYGASALRTGVFQLLQDMLQTTLFNDDSKCAQITKQRIFDLLNDLCDKFDLDGSLAQQPGVVDLCATLLQSPTIAQQFWSLHGKEEGFGVVSLWNTALELFPYNFATLSVLAAGLAEAGKTSVCHLTAELKNLPVYTEVYNPHAVPISSLINEDAVIGRDCYPLGDDSYHIESGSKATIMERKEATFIHYRTPVSYWTVFNSEIEKALDRKGQHQHDLPATLARVQQGGRVLRGVLAGRGAAAAVPRELLVPSEGVCDVLGRVPGPRALLAAGLRVCGALVPAFPREIHARLVNTGILPRAAAGQPAPALAAGAWLEPGCAGAYITKEQTTGQYSFLQAYIDMLCAFAETTDDERITSEIILPGVILILREVFPNLSGWRYVSANERRALLRRCMALISLALRGGGTGGGAGGVAGGGGALQAACVYSLMNTENALQLLQIISVGNEQLERMMHDETNWTSGSGAEYISTVQRCVAVTMLLLRLKNTAMDTKELTPFEHLVFAQNKQSDSLKVVPKVTSYINNTFNNNFAVLCCKLLKKFAEGFQMSLFACLDMTSYQVRVMFLERLRDDFESDQLKVAILEFVATCVGKQPGLTEAFFKMNHVRVKQNEKEDQKERKAKKDDDDSESILGYMADYLGCVKSDPNLLHSPLLACMMGLFHALWKNNMQVLVKELRENPKFWDHMTSPLFSSIQPKVRTYSQIFNVLGIELFLSRNKIEPNLKEMLEKFFNTDNEHLDSWINYIFSFDGRYDEDEMAEKVPTWLGLLTSWKDFTTIFCKCLPISLNIAHKAKMVAPCLSALLNELDDLKDGRLVVILAELYVIMLANWKDDCFENRKANVKQIDQLLTNAAIVYDCLHNRAKRAILSIGTVAISTLDYEIKANTSLAQSIIRSVTNIISLELEKLFDNINGKSEPTDNNEIPPVVISLAMLEQCLDLYDDMFSNLSQWFQSTYFTNKLLCCLQTCLQNRRYYHTSLAALRCLTAYSRSAFSKNLLLSDVDQFLWMQLLPPKFDSGADGWKPQEWWRVYGFALDFISTMVMRHGQYFVSRAVSFVGVHLEHVAEALLMPRLVSSGEGLLLPRHAASMEALQLCAAALQLVVQLVKYEARWRIENSNSLFGIMRSTSACLHHCVTHMLRARRTDQEDGAAHDALLHRTLEILHMSTLCLLSFSPPLLPLLADPALDAARWQPLVEIHFGAPKPSSEQFPQLTFGTLLAAVCMLTKSLNHSYHLEDCSAAAGGGSATGGGGRSPRARRRCSCGSPGDTLRAGRSDSLTSLSSAASAPPALHRRLLAPALHAAVALAAAQALLAVRDPNVPSRHKQLVRRELASELTPFHDFVRKRILCAAHARPELFRNKLGAWPLPPDEEETKRIEEARRKRNPLEADDSLPPPPPPKRPSHDSMREYILRKHYLDKCAQTPTKEPPSPVSHSTPTSDKKKEASRSSKRVSWAETTQSEQDAETTLQEIGESVYSNLTDVQINNDEDYFHFMSVVFLYICQSEL